MEELVAGVCEVLGERRIVAGGSESAAKIREARSQVTEENRHGWLGDACEDGADQADAVQEQLEFGGETEEFAERRGRALQDLAAGEGVNRKL